MEGTPVFVLDASVAVKWYIPEEGRKRALRLRQDYTDGKIDLIAPNLIFFEVGNAVRFHPGATAREVWEAVRGLKGMQVAIQNLTDPVVDSAAEIAFTENITFYDAVYLAIAENFGVKFVTADKKLYEQIKKRKSLISLLEDYV